MKNFLLVVVFFFWICCNGQITPAVNGLNSPWVSNEHVKLIYDNVKSFPNDTQVSIAIIEKGNVKFIGVKRVNDSIVSFQNQNKIFEIGSISKVFTATLLTNLVLDGSIDLNSPIQDYIDFEINTKEVITFKELANHTSGLPRLPSNLDLSSVDPNNPYQKYDLEKLKEYLIEKMELQQKPDTKYEYSNLGAGILGFILSQLTKSTYEELLEEKIFSKYKMKNSTTNNKQAEENLIKGLNPQGEITSNWEFDVLVGAGGILSSVKDLSNFAIAQFNEKNEELVLTQQPTFTVNDHMKIGLGWHIPKNKSGKDLIWHNGGTGGYTSCIALDIENKNGVILLSNVSAFSTQVGNIERLCFALIETLK